MMELCFNYRADELDHKYLDSGDGSSARAMMTCVLPLAEIVTDFFDRLKSRSSGFASFEYVSEGLSSRPVSDYPSPIVTKMRAIGRVIWPR